MLLIYTAYNALTLAHHTLNITASATGEDVSNMIGARVSVGFGAVAEVVAALVLVAGAIAGRRSVAASAVESAVELEPS